MSQMTEFRVDAIMARLSAGWKWNSEEDIQAAKWVGCLIGKDTGWNVGTCVSKKQMISSTSSSHLFSKHSLFLQ